MIPIVAVAVLTVTRPGALARLENAIYDVMLRDTPARQPGGRVVIVDIDEESLSKVGQWPWRRDVIGRLIERLRGLGAAVVALDIIFAEPGLTLRYPGPRHSAPTPRSFRHRLC